LATVGRVTAEQRRERKRWCESWMAGHLHVQGKYIRRAGPKVGLGSREANEN